MQQESCFYFSVSSKTFVRTKPTEQETGFWFQPEGHAALLKEPQSSVLIWWVDGEHDWLDGDDSPTTQKQPFTWKWLFLIVFFGRLRFRLVALSDHSREEFYEQFEKCGGVF